jgi:hypothetical protein
LSLQGINAELQNLLAKLHSRPQLNILPINGQALLSGPAAAALHGGGGALLPYQHGHGDTAAAVAAALGGGLQAQHQQQQQQGSAAGVDDKSHQQAEELVKSAWKAAKGMVAQCREQLGQQQLSDGDAGGGGGGRGSEPQSEDGVAKDETGTGVAIRNGEGGSDGKVIAAAGSGEKSVKHPQHRAFVDDLVSKAVGLLLTLQKCTKPSQQLEQVQQQQQEGGLGGGGMLSTCVACDALTRAVLNNRSSGENLELYKRVLDSVQILKGQLARVC